MTQRDAMTSVPGLTAEHSAAGPHLDCDDPLCPGKAQENGVGDLRHATRDETAQASLDIVEADRALFMDVLDPGRTDAILGRQLPSVLRCRHSRAYASCTPTPASGSRQPTISRMG